MDQYQDRWIEAEGGLRLYLRDYCPVDPGLTLLCLHGLTRNSADFEELASRLGDQHRVLVMDQRGRGRSDYDSDPQRYGLTVYVRDVIAALDQLDVERVVAVGTSMGGLMTLLLAQRSPERIIGAVLNDVGPVVEAAGLARIQGYVGKGEQVSTWEEAAAIVRANNEVAYPDWGDAQWLAFARKMFTEVDGSLRLAYDPAISEPLNAEPASSVPTDVWPLFDALRPVPTLVVRGATSDILSVATVEAMQVRHPDLVSVEVPGRGHAPTLDEPEALAAIDLFLARLA